MAQANDKVITFGNLRNSGCGSEINFVTFSEAQTLTSTQKTQVQDNIGVTEILGNLTNIINNI